MRDRPTSVSVHATSIAAKDSERQRLEADVAAFLRRRGNRIQRLDPHETSRPLQLDFREVNSAIADARRRSAAARRKRSRGEEE
jgi:hypothetical protein